MTTYPWMMTTKSSASSTIVPNSWNVTFEYENETILNVTPILCNDSSQSINETRHSDIINNVNIQAGFYALYATIFILGLFGNALVCYIVYTSQGMKTVTNYFIANLALSDILLCVLAVPFTPLYTFKRRWIFGTLLCHLVPYAQGCSVYISTLTLTAIAIDRFLVICYPFAPRSTLGVSVYIIILIWVVSLLITLPYGLYIKLYESNFTGSPTLYCEEDWPNENYRNIFGTVTTILQFVLPFIIISFCYAFVSIRLNHRIRARPGSRTIRREQEDRSRKKRTNYMLIGMVAIFGFSWLPLNLVNIINDFYSRIDETKYYTLLFFISHAIAMSSTCYNPFLYAWLNDNFRSQFKQVLPCYKTKVQIPEPCQRTCNGNNETIQESLLQTAEAFESSVGGTKKDSNVSSGGCDAVINEENENDDGNDKIGNDIILLSDVKPPLIENNPFFISAGVLETPFETNQKVHFANNFESETIPPPSYEECSSYNNQFKLNNNDNAVINTMMKQDTSISC